jgi:hypothetical protein
MDSLLKAVGASWISIVDTTLDHHRFTRAERRGGESQILRQLKSAASKATIPRTATMGPKTNPPNQLVYE